MIKTTNSFDITIPIQDQLQKPEKEKGVIYYSYCNLSKKGYIGQSSNYVSGNIKWGTIGRWKSHVRKANSGEKDHCLLLNQAIRKYGESSFTIITVHEAPLNELNDLETYYIEVFNTLTPNGYNLEKGGRCGKILSEQTRKKFSEMRKGTVRPPEECKKISQGQLGSRRDVKNRKHPEDANIPKYINAMRENGKLVGYKIDSFPIGITEKKYIKKSFRNKESVQDAYNKGITFLEDLKKKYSYIDTEINKYKNEKIKESQQKKIENKVKNNIPEYIFPIIKNNKIDGYYVEGYLDNNNNPYSKKEFTDLVSNSRNLRAAKRYIESLEVLNKNNKFKEQKIDQLINIGRHKHSEKKSNDTTNLPKYLAYVTVHGEKIGYQVNNFPISKNEKVKRKFCGKKIPMEEKYKQATDYLKELWNKKNELQRNRSNTSDNDSMSDNDTSDNDNMSENDTSDYDYYDDISNNDYVSDYDNISNDDILDDDIRRNNIIILPININYDTNFK